MSTNRGGDKHANDALMALVLVLAHCARVLFIKTKNKSLRGNRKVFFLSEEMEEEENCERQGQSRLESAEILVLPGTSTSTDKIAGRARL
jgi:hypothetical protein